MASLEVGGDDGSILFLASGVPDVEFGEFIMKVDVFDFEIDCGDLSLLFCEEIALSEPPEQGGFSNVAVPNKDELVLLFLAIR